MDYEKLWKELESRVSLIEENGQILQSMWARQFRELMEDVEKYNG